ncbi:MAG: hypothetical protein APR63_09685 [Desulfuromonas sp. SDB]|nr:MAG: hypothetical protein APR63_09685 [Desulfuromonas sp. SDB]
MDIIFDILLHPVTKIAAIVIALLVIARYLFRFLKPLLIPPPINLADHFPLEVLDKISITLFAFEISPPNSDSRKMKDFLDEHEFLYQFKDIKSDENYREMVEESRQKKYPALIIKSDNNSPRIIIGFNKKQMNQLLKDIFSQYTEIKNKYYKLS